MLTLLVASLTETSAVLGDPSLMEPRLAFWIAPAPMETLPVVAPFMRATGMPPMRAQEPPHRPLETESRFPPDPPKASRAPPMLACDPPLTASRGPLSRDSVLPLRRLTRSPATLSTLPPPTLTSAPLATARRLASRATSDEAEERRLAPLRRMASMALVSTLPFLKWSRGAVASRSAVSTWSTWLVVDGGAVGLEERSGGPKRDIGGERPPAVDVGRRPAAHQIEHGDLGAEGVRAALEGDKRLLGRRHKLAARQHGEQAHSRGEARVAGAEDGTGQAHLGAGRHDH